MGTCFTIDSPIRVARYGISSVISLVDDNLIEDVRKFYAARYKEPFTPIKKFDDDWRARRIKEYLDLVHRIVEKQIEDVRSALFQPGSEITRYFELLPESAPSKIIYNRMLATQDLAARAALQAELRPLVLPGRIDVNIMTKLDKPNVDRDGNLLPEEFSDALAALRGFAQSTINGAIELSAGFNRRLYTYIEEFSDFYADAAGKFKKEIILKVSDYRSAITQGKFLARKGLWVSEFRIESGLNCGGHAFAGSGNLMGPVLEEFKLKREELISQLDGFCREALKLKNKTIPENKLSFRVTAQGGIGTFNEDIFLKRHYSLATTGWGSPFLLIPEAVQIDKETLQRLAAAGENDLFLSDVSPLNVAFNNLRNSLSELKRCELINNGTPGSPCILGHLATNTEFTKNPICTASRTYQKLKLEALKAMGLSKEEYDQQSVKVTDKACICSQLGDGFYKNTDQDKKIGTFPAVCPGPNIAYFNRAASLKEMIDHIYGRTNIMPFPNRPHMFIKELKLNLDQFAKLCAEKKKEAAERKDTAHTEFRQNLEEGIAYYRGLIPQITEETELFRNKMLHELDLCAKRLATL